MPDLISMRELSRRCGVTLRAIQLAVQNNRIEAARVEKRGQRTRVFFDAEKSVADFNNNRDAGMKNAPTRAEMGKGPQPSGKEEPGPDLPTGQLKAAPGDTSALGKARTVKTIHQAKLAELDYKARAGELVEFDKASELFSYLASNTKQNILNVASRVSALVAPEKSERACYDIIYKELKEALRGLSEGLSFGSDA